MKNLYIIIYFRDIGERIILGINYTVHLHKELKIKIIKQKYKAIASSSIDFLFKSTMKLSRESPWLPRVITGVMFDGRLVSPRVVLPWALGEKRDINGVQHTLLLELIRAPGHALHRHAYDRVSLHA